MSFLYNNRGYIYTMLAVVIGGIIGINLIAGIMAVTTWLGIGFAGYVINGVIVGSIIGWTFFD